LTDIQASSLINEMDNGKVFNKNKFEKWLYKNCQFLTKTALTLRAEEAEKLASPGRSIGKKCLINNNFSNLESVSKSPLLSRNTHSLGKFQTNFTSAKKYFETRTN